MIATPSRPSPKTLAVSWLDEFAQQIAGAIRLDAPSIEADWRDWLTTLFPGYFSSFAPQHEAFWDWVWALDTGTRPTPFVGIWPRGGGKSTNAEAACVAVGARRVRSYVLYISATQEQADDHVQNVAALLESPQIETFYPALAQRKIGKFGNAKGWRRNRLRTASGLTIDAVGLDTAARGVKLEDARPDLLVIDDIDHETDTSVTTAKKIRRLTHAILPAGSDDAAVLAIQNLVLPDGVFARLAGTSQQTADFLVDRMVSGPHPALRDLTYEEQDGRAVITSGEPTWDGMGLDRCQQMIDTMGLTAFLSECQHLVRQRGEPIIDVDWWHGRNRYIVGPAHQTNQRWRWLSWDTALSDADTAAFSACTVAEMNDNRTLSITEVWRGHLAFHDLVDQITALAERHNRDGKLREVLIENKASGISAIQTLQATAPHWLRSRITGWTPQGSKEYRAKLASVWCQRGMVLLPEPSLSVPWLLDFESELEHFPRGDFKDQVDSFTQLILYLEPWIEQGWHALGRAA